MDLPGKKTHNKFSQSAARGFKSSNTTGSTCSLVSMLLSIGLQKSLFFVNIPHSDFGDFWYVIEDMFLDKIR